MNSRHAALIDPNLPLVHWNPPPPKPLGGMPTEPDRVLSGSIHFVMWPPPDLEDPHVHICDDGWRLRSMASCYCAGSLISDAVEIISGLIGIIEGADMGDLQDR